MGCDGELTSTEWRDGVGDDDRADSPLGAATGTDSEMEDVGELGSGVILARAGTNAGSRDAGVIASGRSMSEGVDSAGREGSTVEALSGIVICSFVVGAGASVSTSDESGGVSSSIGGVGEAGTGVGAIIGSDNVGVISSTGTSSSDFTTTSSTSTVLTTGSLVSFAGSTTGEAGIDS